VAEGIEKDRLVASINRFIFNLQQMKEPQGLIRGLNCMSSWLYDGDPMQYLHFEDCFAELRSMAENGGFEPLLKEMLVDGQGLCKLHVLPSETYGADLREAEVARLSKEKAAFTDAQLDAISQEFAALSQWQQTPDSPEQLATLPKLDLSEISPDPVLCETSEELCDGVTVLRHKAASNGIVHISAYFRLTDRTLEELTKLALVSKLLGVLPTKAKDATTLQNEIKTWLGELKFAVEVNPKFGQKAQCTPVLAVHCSVLKENVSKAEELICEILTSTDFTQSNRILEIVKQQETEQQQIGMMNGHLLAFLSAQSHFSAAGAAQAATKGISYIQWLHTLSKNFEAELPGFTALVENTLAAAVCKDRMILSFTEDGCTDAASFLGRFSEGKACADTCTYVTDLPKKLGIRIPAQVSYASLATSLDIPYEGSARLLSNVLSLAYLWNEVRVKGGAYGAGMRISRNGGLFTYSYRDPNPSNSLSVYRSMADCVRSLVAAGQDITGFIISTIAETEPLEDAGRIGQTADGDWFFGWTREQALAERKELLNATTEELTKWCDALESLKEDAGICVVGYADALAACEAEGLTVLDI
jgi:Zn-dependent M16 (insulinase) family peptidase